MVAKRDCSDLVSFLKMQGLLYKFDGRFSTLLTILQHIRLMYFGGVYPLIMMSIYRTGLKDSLSKYAFLASAGFYISIKAISYFLNQKETHEIIERLIKLMEKRSQPWEHEVFYKYSYTIWKFVNAYSYIAIFYIVTYFVCPLIYDIYLAAFTESKEPFNLPFPLETLTNKERSFTYYALLFVSLIWSGLLLSYALGSLAVLWVVVSYCCIDIRILCRTIEDFGNDGKNIQKMGKLIDDYRDILELSQVMKKVIGPPLAAQNAVGSLLLTLFLYSATILDDIMLLGVSMFSLVAVSFVMFFSCFIGEILQSESIKLFETFCELPWYEMNIEMRKTLNFIILVARRPMVIDYKGKLALNLETFMQIVNSSYSYFMLLNSMN